MSNYSDRFLDMYTTLVDNGVRFYYSDNDLYLGEVTKLDIRLDNKLEMQIEFNETHIVEIEDFLHNHSKENINYYDWENVRIFDDILKEI